MKEIKELSGLWIGKLSQANSWYHIFPFAAANSTKKLHIVRYDKTFYDIPKAIYYHYKVSSSIVEFLKLYSIGKKVIKRNKIDYIVTFNPYPWGIIAWILAKRFKIPVSVGLIGKDYDIGLHKSKYRKFLKHLLKTSDYVTITGNAMRSFLEKIGVKSNQIGIYPHCIKDEWFELDETIKKEYDVVTVCELIERKKVEDIIESIYILQEKGVKVKLCIVGDGPLMNRLTEMVKNYRLEENIHFAGFQKDVISYLKKSRIYVQSSRQEGLSISLIESMVAGLVPVTTIAGSEKDIIENGKNGILIKIGQPQDIANAIETLMNKDNYEKYRNAILEYRNHFRIDRAIEASEKIIKQITE